MSKICDNCGYQGDDSESVCLCGFILTEATAAKVAYHGKYSKGDNIDPDHYNRMPIPPTAYISQNKLEWEVGNIIKYVSRYRNKNGIEDLRKAKKYLELLTERVYGEKL